MRYQRASRSKYNVRTDAKGIEDRTADNIVFHSVREKNAYVNEFRPLMRCGNGVKVELQKPYQLFACGGMALGQEGLFPIEVCTYIADFVVTEVNGTVRVYDSKGFRTPEFKLKKKLFEACYPHLRIVEI